MPCGDQPAQRLPDPAMGNASAGPRTEAAVASARRLCHSQQPLRGSRAMWRSNRQLHRPVLAAARAGSIDDEVACSCGTSTRCGGDTVWCFIQSGCSAALEQTRRDISSIATGWSHRARYAVHGAVVVGAAAAAIWGCRRPRRKERPPAPDRLRLRTTGRGVQAGTRAADLLSSRFGCGSRSRGAPAGCGGASRSVRDDRAIPTDVLPVAPFSDAITARREGVPRAGRSVGPLAPRKCRPPHRRRRSRAARPITTSMPRNGRCRG